MNVVSGMVCPNVGYVVDGVEYEGIDNPTPMDEYEEVLDASCFLSLALLLLNQTCILASVSFVLCASSSRVYISGYWVRSNAFSNSSS